MSAMSPCPYLRSTCEASNILNLPERIGHTRRDRGRHARRLVDADEIIVHEVDGKRVDVVFNLF